MIYKGRIHVRAHRAKYPTWLFQDIEANSPEEAKAHLRTWAEKLKGSKGPHTVLGVFVRALES